LDQEPRPADRRVEQLTRLILDDAATLAAARTTAGLRAARAALHLEEVLSSVALAGFVLDRTAGTALLARGVALGDRPLAVYEAVADYADATRVIDGPGASATSAPSRAAWYRPRTGSFPERSWPWSIALRLGRLPTRRRWRGLRARTRA
jgi:hypothetical protein